MGVGLMTEGLRGLRDGRLRLEKDERVVPSLLIADILVSEELVELGSNCCEVGWRL
jgi:hypothetical protein